VFVYQYMKLQGIRAKEYSKASSQAPGGAQDEEKAMGGGRKMHAERCVSCVLCAVCVSVYMHTFCV